MANDIALLPLRHWRIHRWPRGLLLAFWWNRRNGYVVHRVVVWPKRTRRD